jgi:hypothetical protein
MTATPSHTFVGPVYKSRHEWAFTFFQPEYTSKPVKFNYPHKRGTEEARKQIATSENVHKVTSIPLMDAIMAVVQLAQASGQTPGDEA